MKANITCPTQKDIIKLNFDSQQMNIWIAKGSQSLVYLKYCQGSLVLSMKK